MEKRSRGGRQHEVGRINGASSGFVVIGRLRAGLRRFRLNLRRDNAVFGFGVVLTVKIYWRLI